MSNTKRSQSRGAALVEFAIVLPLIILFVQVLMHLGWAFTQLTWVSQTAFHVAMTGSEFPVNTGAGPMAARHNLLDTIQHQWLEAPLNLADPVYDVDNATVRVQVDGNVPALMWALNQSLTVSVTAPILVRGEGNPGDLNVFENPSTFYDCDGNPCTGSGTCEPVSCLTPPPVTSIYAPLVTFCPFQEC